MRFHEWFEMCGKTQEEVAEGLSTTQGYVSKLVAGATPSDEMAERIEKYTGNQVTFLEMKHPRFRRASNG